MGSIYKIHSIGYITSGSDCIVASSEFYKTHNPYTSTQGLKFGLDKKKKMLNDNSFY